MDSFLVASLLWHSMQHCKSGWWGRPLVPEIVGETDAVSAKKCQFSIQTDSIQKWDSKMQNRSVHPMDYFQQLADTVWPGKLPVKQSPFLSLCDRVGVIEADLCCGETCQVVVVISVVFCA